MLLEQNCSGETALHAAAAQGHDDVVAVLLQVWPCCPAPWGPCTPITRHACRHPPQQHAWYSLLFCDQPAEVPNGAHPRQCTLLQANAAPLVSEAIEWKTAHSAEHPINLCVGVGMCFNQGLNRPELWCPG